ncbi:hypothetical protein N7526_002281 [Penicillium atrosanguineum]|nr:hypothetical protein N7526_002281 [Penicillium atrosanguineum]
MVNEAPASLPVPESRSIHAVSCDTDPQRPPAIRSVSLPTPEDAPQDTSGRSLSTSSASPSHLARPATAVAGVNFSRRHDGLRPSTSGGDGTRSLRSEGSRSDAPSLCSVPSIVINDAAPALARDPAPGRELERDMDTEEPPPVPRIEPSFSGISMDIPTGSLGGLGQTMKFSTRGSLIKKDKKRPHPGPRPEQVSEEPSDERSEMSSGPPSERQSIQQDIDITPSPSPAVEELEPEKEMPKVTPRPPRPQSTLRPRQSSLQSRAISADEDMLSRRVRLMYEKGDDNVTDSDVVRAMANDNGVLWEEGTPDAETVSIAGPNLTLQNSNSESNGRASAEVERIRMKRETQELAGGIEDWQDVGAGQVDRYGFIHAPPDSTEPHPIQRVTTSLLLASEAPRRKRSIRPPSAMASNRSFNGRSPTRKGSQSSTGPRPTSSASTISAPVRRSTSRLRSATNRLPHNRDRKFTDEAADMLTLPAEAATGDGQDTPIARAARKKEWQREDKWTKMAKPTKKSGNGGGMSFEFDTTSSKLIERTWKGIPDRWRATAWYSFLATSAKRHADSPSEDDLIDAFHEYQYVSSPDDLQIDIDVPRTITSHIMFRRRYRGGQRLLFRVLHAMSLYFPDTGYVQGMAALAATLLAYYDEEHAFVMLARLWRLRGLEELYRSGFAGLMEALDDFEREWLAGGEVAIKLTEVGIPPTAYGTRWYLTLFNYSIPFPAQLRVWDVFMLLGDSEDLSAPTRPSTSSSKGGKKEPGTFGQGLDVLHATSAALIDGMRDIILESDFENVMKVLTSWVPIKDIELFMRVAKAEWKVHRRKNTHH